MKRAVELWYLTLYQSIKQLDAMAVLQCVQ